MTRTLPLLAVLTALWVFVPPASAQFTGTPDEVHASGTAYRTFHLPGERTVTVQMLGDIGSGIYVLGSQTTLLELITLAGGAPLGDPGARTRREFTVRLFRETQAGVRDIVYESTLRDMLQTPGQYPQLQNGDLVTVDMTLRDRFDFFRALQITSSLASMVLLVLRLSERL